MSTKRKRVTAPKATPEKTESQKEMELVMQEKNNMYKKTKLMLDKCCSEVTQALDDVARLADRYPDAVVSFFRNSITTFQEHVKCGQQQYGKLVTDVSFTTQTKGDVETQINNMQSVLKQVEEHNKQFKTGVWADVKKLTT